MPSSSGDLAWIGRRVTQRVTSRTATWGLFAAVLLAIAARSLGANVIFVDDDVLLYAWDGSYHARRALYSFVEFPSILFQDPYLNFPDGAPIPMPPLYDWLLAAVARCFGSSEGVFARVAAWSSPVLAALTLLPTYALARQIRGRGPGLAAALLLALIPASTTRTQLGDADHHAAVALLLAVALYAGTVLLQGDTKARRRRSAELLLFLARTTMVLTWSGSLLYVAVGEAAFLLAALLANRPGLLEIQARGAALSALAIAPWVFASPVPVGGPLTTTTLSWIHPLALCAVAAVALMLGGAERAWPTRAVGVRLARGAGVVIAGCAFALGVPAIREAILPAAAFLAKTDTWGARNLEQMPLFSRGATTFGWWSYGFPLLPVVFLAARSIPLNVRVYLALWSGCLAALTISQARFGSDAAPLACVAIAVLLEQTRTLLATRVPGWTAWVIAVAVGLVLSWTPIYGALSNRVQLALKYRSVQDGVDPAILSASSSLVRFAESVRANTPETSGFFDPDARPEYGILVKPSFGHVFSYVARRATPATGFGPYLDAEKYERSLAFYRARNAREAFELLDLLGTRYLVTRTQARQTPRHFTHLLHVLDGSSRDGRQSVGELRLVVEGPAGGMPIKGSFRGGKPKHLVPYKLFERVPGAVLEVEAPPETTFYTEVTVETNIGRHFVFRAHTRASANGIARLRVPYATDAEGATRVVGLYRILIGKHDGRAIHVLESDVETGAVLTLQPRRN